jgi:hypothetical protein
MKRGSFLAVVCFFVFCASGAEAVKVRLNSYSLLLRPATTKLFGNSYVNEVTSDTQLPLSNGELELAPDAVPYTHWGFFLYHDPTTGDVIPFDFAVDIPTGDADSDGLPDILQFSMSASQRKIGEYFDDFGDSGTIQCDWAKAADSYRGTCKVTFDFGISFTHTFEILEYAGDWSGAEISSDGEGSVNLHLARSGVDGEFLEGPLKFSIVAKKLTVHATSALKAQDAAAFTFIDDAVATTSGQLIKVFPDVVDGTPSNNPDIANFQDFNEWRLLITDPNDANANGVPDLLEATAQPIQPTLEIIKTAQGVRIVIHGEVGRTYVLEDATSLPPGVWEHPFNVTATTDAHAVDLSAPSGTIYWRARVL